MLRRLLLLLCLALLIGCPTSGGGGGDDDDATGDDDDATGDDDDATGDDDDATGDDDDATGDDDDSGDDDDDDPTGSCRFLTGTTLAACQPSDEAPCNEGDAPKGITTVYEPEACPGGEAASCATDEPGNVDWFYYLDQSSELLEAWCEGCTSDMTPAGYCDSVSD